MKKIIAAALATAFVAPAMAADITISGSMKYDYIMSDAAAVGDKVAKDDPAIKITASEELANGMSVKATFNIVDDGDESDDLDTQGSNVTVSGAFGSVGIGDNSGALDATGDWTDTSPVFGGFRGDGNDAVLAYTLPTFVDGLTLRAAMSPEGVNAVTNASGLGNGDTGADSDAEGNEHSSFSATYAVGPFAVYYGEEAEGRAANEEVESKAYGVKYSANGIYVAYESGESTNVGAPASGSAYENLGVAVGEDIKYTGLAANYTMGDVKVGVEMQKVQEDGATLTAVEETIMFVSYNLGGGLSVHAASRASDSDYAASQTKVADQTAIGISYSF